MKCQVPPYVVLYSVFEEEDNGLSRPSCAAFVYAENLTMRCFEFTLTPRVFASSLSYLKSAHTKNIVLCPNFFAEVTLTTLPSDPLSLRKFSATQNTTSNITRESTS